MNRLYIIQMGSREIRGLISYSELLDFVVCFEREARLAGAEAKYIGKGSYMVRREGEEATLTIGKINYSIPGPSVFKAMEMMFNFLNNKKL